MLDHDDDDKRKTGYGDGSMENLIKEIDAEW
jgi:hypothetical protein